MAEDSRIDRRVRRYAQVGAGVGGLAVKLAGSKLLGLDLDRQRHAEDLKRALGGLKGPIMKVAQMMATIPEALPKEYAAELAQLQSQAPAMGWPFVKRRMAAELGPDWEKKFKNFERQAAAAASLGQVHRAAHKDGRALAVKLQYPDMQSAVSADLAQLGAIFSIYRRLDPAIDTRQMEEEISARLREELDYGLEARHMNFYRAIFANDPLVNVPAPVPELSTTRLLTMEWVEGTPLLDHKGRSLADRNQIATAMFRAWWHPFATYGVIHGDPHLGNYNVRSDLGINLLDFGCIRVFPPRFVGGVIDLYQALHRNDRALAVHAYETWGFKNLSQELIDTLNIWAGFIYGPLLDDRERTIADGISPGDYGREQATKVHARLKELGPVQPPREFVFMDRAAIGLGGVFLHLDARLNWYRLFNEAIEGYAFSALVARQQAALDAAKVPHPA